MPRTNHVTKMTTMATMDTTRAARLTMVTNVYSTLTPSRVMPHASRPSLSPVSLTETTMWNAKATAAMTAPTTATASHTTSGRISTNATLLRHHRPNAIAFTTPEMLYRRNVPSAVGRQQLSANGKNVEKNPIVNHKTNSSAEREREGEIERPPPSPLRTSIIFFFFSFFFFFFFFFFCSSFLVVEIANGSRLGRAAAVACVRARAHFARTVGVVRMQQLVGPRAVGGPEHLVVQLPDGGIVVRHAQRAIGVDGVDGLDPLQKNVWGHRLRRRLSA